MQYKSLKYKISYNLRGSAMNAFVSKLGSVSQRTGNLFCARNRILSLWIFGQKKMTNNDDGYLMILQRPKIPGISGCNYTPYLSSVQAQGSIAYWLVNSQIFSKKRPRLVCPQPSLHKLTPE